MAFPVAGDFAPNFKLLNQHGERVELIQYRGKSKVVVYFYPRALTPGCTVQGCAIRDSQKDFDALNAVVLGISPDTPEKLKKFDEKYNLGFNILSDVDHAVAEAYGVWGLKKFMGKEFMGIIRTSFIIDISGHVMHVFEKVNTKTHNSNIISYLVSQR